MGTVRPAPAGALALAVALAAVLAPAAADAYSATLSSQSSTSNPRTLTWTLTNTPPATGTVTISLRALGDFNSTSEYVTVYVGGTGVGNLFGATNQCSSPTSRSLTVAAATWNAARSADGRVTVQARGSTSVGVCAMSADGSVSYASNGAPSLSTDGPWSVAEGGTVAVSASATDPEGEAISYEWDLDANGSFETPGASATFRAFGIDGPATRTIAVRATDTAGTSSETSATVTITNAAPTCSAGAAASADEGATWTRTATANDAGGDTLSYRWEFGDGSAATAAAAASHAWADDGTYTAKVTVTDDDGATCTSTAAITVRNLAPTCSAGAVATVAEGATFTRSATASDPAGAKDTISFEWEYGDGTSSQGRDASHAWADDGVYTLTLRARDEDGGTCTSTVLVTATDVAPVAVPGAPLEGVEGTPVELAGSHTGAPTDRVTYAWTFADGTSADGASAAHTFCDDGTFTATLTVTDDDGSKGTAELALTIANVPPTVEAGADLEIDEGSEKELQAQVTDPGTCDVVTVAWDFGDGATASQAAARHAWADDGTFTVAVTATDDDGGTQTDRLTVTARNVAPTITSTAGAFAREAQEYTYAVVATDPGGAADPLLYTLAKGPEGAGLGTDGTLRWTPQFAQAGTLHEVVVTVADGDGGLAEQRFTIAVDYRDEDADGLPDTWEAANGLDPTTPGDKETDGDADGFTNLEEWERGSNPAEYDGPRAPAIASPVDGGEVEVAAPALAVTNAQNPSRLALSYLFEIFDDAELTQRRWASDEQPEGVDTTETTATEAAALEENGLYFWRARARNERIAGPWSEVASFRVNQRNDPPSAPAISRPAIGHAVDTLTPSLEVTNATDPDGDALTYAFELYADAALSQLVQQGTAAGGDAGATTWTAGEALAEDTRYWWRVRAIDEHGLAGEWGQTGELRVNTENGLPTAPVLVAPAHEGVVTSRTVELAAGSAVDPEGDALRYVFEIDAKQTFDSPVAERSLPTSPGADGVARWIMETPLVEGATYYWRAQAIDQEGSGPWAQASFSTPRARASADGCGCGSAGPDALLALAGLAALATRRRRR